MANGQLLHTDIQSHLWLTETNTFQVKLRSSLLSTPLNFYTTQYVIVHANLCITENYGKNNMHNEVWGNTEITPPSFSWCSTIVYWMYRFDEFSNSYHLSLVLWHIYYLPKDKTAYCKGQLHCTGSDRMSEWQFWKASKNKRQVFRTKQTNKKHDQNLNNPSKQTNMICGSRKYLNLPYRRSLFYGY